MKAEFMAGRAEIAAFQAETRSEFAAVRAKLAAFKIETRNQFTAVRSEMKLLEQPMTIKLGAMPVALDGILIAAIRSMPAR